MPAVEYKVDGLATFERGMNADLAPLLLPKNQLFKAINATVRGTFVRPRPVWRRIDFEWTEGNLSTDLEGYFQAVGYYKPDSGSECLMTSVAGRLYQFTPSATVATAAVIERSTPAIQQSATAPEAWLWQAEKWMIWNDGVSNPVFLTDTTIARSNYGTKVKYNSTVSDAYTVLAIGVTSAALTFDNIQDAAHTEQYLYVGDTIRMPGVGRFMVQTVVLNAGGGTTDGEVTLLNINGLPEGRDIATGWTAYWSRAGTELPPGRMGAYGMGRVWESLTDGKQFVASDLVGGSSGTQAEDYRDAVLNVTENNYLAGGGNFAVPGSIGDIKAMRFTAVQDASLGQGPLQVFTPNAVFSCNAPVDRLTWQDLENPILTVSLITNGALNQDGTLNVNGDVLFRSKEGLRSLTLARRDFNTWGTPPISSEVEYELAKDAQGLLQYGSAVVFDNRYLHTFRPINDNAGVWHEGLAVINFDPVSSLQGKAPSVWDGLWTGLNILKIVKGEFASVERCFAFVRGMEGDLQLFELMPQTYLESAGVYTDAGGLRPTWIFETPVMDFGQKDPRNRQLLQLVDGEIAVMELRGTVNFRVRYKMDEYPCWQDWASWEECASVEETVNAEGKPQFRPRMGFGTPSANPCDATTNRPLREGYYVRLRFEIQGYCIPTAIRVKAVTKPEPQFAPLDKCTEVCA